MDLSLYHILIQGLDPLPDLSVAQNGDVWPEEWPVVLEKINTYRKQLQSFTVTDGRHHLLCFSDSPHLYDRIAQTELGTIIHLLGARPIRKEGHKNYVLLVEDTASLKQYDEKLKAVREAEARRMAEAHDELQEYLDYSHPGHSQPS